MTRQPMSIDTLEAVKLCFERYGADPALWPAEDRDVYGAYVEVDELATSRADALALDGFLGAATAPRMNDDLPANIMAGFDAHMTQRSKRSWFAIDTILSSLFVMPRFASAGAFAAAAVLGVTSGVITASGSVTAPEAEAYAYLIDATPSLFEDAEIIE